MILSAATPTQYSANRFVFIFSIAAIGAVVMYYVYGAVNRMGLKILDVEATVVAKQHNPSGRAYTTVIAGGRPWVQSRELSDTYVVVLQIAGEQTGGLVSPEIFESLNVGEKVRTKVRRTRLSRRLEAIEITQK